MCCIYIENQHKICLPYAKSVAVACNILMSTSCSLSVSVSLSRPWAGPGALSARLSGLHRLSLCRPLQLGQSSESRPAPARHQPSHCHRHGGPVPMQLRSSHSRHDWNHTQLIGSEGSHVVFFCDIFYHQKLHLHFIYTCLNFSLSLLGCRSAWIRRKRSASSKRHQRRLSTNWR